MSRRKPTDKRRFYSKEEKEYILSKTGGRCAHCGKPLTIKTMQKDHSIPWSKGGAGDIENIVPLCSECNKEKADKVYSPKDYFFYLKKSIKMQLQEYFDQYLSGVDYLEFDNMFPTDSFKISTYYPMLMGRRTQCLYIDDNLTFTKALYSDLDEIYYFLIDYYNQYGMGEISSIQEVKQYISDIFLYGSFLILRSKAGNLVLVIAIFLDIQRFLKDGKNIEEVLIYNGKQVCHLKTKFSFFFSPKLDMYLFYRGLEKGIYSKGVTNTYKYLFPIPRIVNMVVNAFKGEKCAYSISISMSDRDPRSKYILECIADNDIPSKEEEIQGRYPIFHLEDLNLYIENTHITTKDLKEISNIFFKDELVQYAFINATKVLVNRMKDAKLYDSWLAYQNAENIIFAYDYADKLGLSYPEIFKKIVKEGYLPVFNEKRERVYDL